MWSNRILHVSISIPFKYFNTIIIIIKQIPCKDIFSPSLHQQPFYRKTKLLWRVGIKSDPKRNMGMEEVGGVREICGPAFSRTFSLDGVTRFFYFFSENLIFRKRLGVATYLIFFKGKNKIRNKNPKCDSWRKNKFMENQSRVRGSGYLLGRYSGDP